MIEGLFQPTHLIIIMVMVLIIFGPGKLPEIGGALGKGIREFKHNTNAADDEPKAPVQQVVASRPTVSASDPNEV